MAGFSCRVRKYLVARECVVVDAASIEPVSTARLPCYQGKEQGFIQFCAILGLRPSQIRNVGAASHQNSLDIDAGKYFRRTEESTVRSGNSMANETGHHR
jgi:hypothetical protein